MRKFAALVFLSLLATVLAGAEKTPTPEAILVKAAELTNLSSTGPLKLTAKVKLLGMANGSVEAEFNVHWAGPDDWRSDWKFQNLFQTQVSAGGKRWTQSNILKPVFRFMQFQSAMYSVWDWSQGTIPNVKETDEETEYNVRLEKRGDQRVVCLRQEKRGASSQCFFFESGLPLIQTSSYGTYIYDNYQDFGGVQYPGTIEVAGYKNRPAIQAHLSVEKWDPSDRSLFVPPAGVEVSDLPRCQAADTASRAVSGVLVKEIKPEYPLPARVKKQEGQVILSAVIGKDGSVKQLEVVQSAGKDFDESAMKAVKQWRWRPYSFCGEPSEVETMITANYSLR